MTFGVAPEPRPQLKRDVGGGRVDIPHHESLLAARPADHSYVAHPGVEPQGVGGPGFSLSLDLNGLRRQVRRALDGSQTLDQGARDDRLDLSFAPKGVLGR
jgi:hypothetical protein